MSEAALLTQDDSPDMFPTGLAAAVLFFSRLYEGQTGMLELRTVIRTDTPDQRRLAWRLRDFVPVMAGKFNSHRIDRFLNETTKHHMAAYFGVALRTPQAAIVHKGTGAYCQTLPAVYVDADFKHLGEAETRRRLAAFPLQPNIIVNSGGGLHPYWTMRPTLDLQTREAYAFARDLLQRIALSVADIVDTGVSEPARVLRIPGSFNFKPEYGEPRPVVLEKIWR